MPEAHIHKLDPHASKPDSTVKQPPAKSIMHLAIEVPLIGVGVFPGLAGEQWREHRRHVELAESSLRGFRSEIVMNRKVVAGLKAFGELTRGMSQGMSLIPPQEKFDAFAQAAEAYYGDAVFLEPKLIEQYDQLILHIDRALGK